MTFEMRVLGLEPQSAEAKVGTLTIIRQRREETVEQAFFRHYAERPEDAASGQVVFLYAFSAATAADRPGTFADQGRGEGRPPISS